MNRFALLPLLALAACPEGDKTTDTDTDTTPPTTTDTGTGGPADETGNVGSILVRESHPTQYLGFDYAENLYGFALFAGEDDGFVNLAGCLLGDPCVGEYPAVGESVLAVPYGGYYWDSRTYDVGDSISVGDLTLARSFYQGNFLYEGTPSALGSGQGGIALDGDFAPYSGTADFTWTGSMQVLSPDPLSRVELDPTSSQVELTWTPGATGEVYLEINGTTVLRLEDDGAETLTLEDLGLEGPLDTATFVVTRATLSEVDASGNAIWVQTRSDQFMWVVYRDITGRTELVSGVNAADDCDAAKKLPALAPGSYYGTTSGADDEHDLGLNNPVTTWDSPGNDLVVPIALLAGQTLDVTYGNPYDAATYLLPDSCDEDDALAGADEMFFTDPEAFDYTASADETVYLVLDSYYEGGDYIRVDITVTGP